MEEIELNYNPYFRKPDKIVYKGQSNFLYDPEVFRGFVENTLKGKLVLTFCHWAVYHALDCTLSYVDMRRYAYEDTLIRVEVYGSEKKIESLEKKLNKASEKILKKATETKKVIEGLKNGTIKL